MRFEKTRLFIAKPVHARGDGNTAPPAAAAAPRAVVSDADEPTRFLAVERLLEQRGLAASASPAQVRQAPPLAAALEDTELREAFARASWIGRARSAWRSLSRMSRLSLALLVVAALLTLTPRLFSDVRARAPAAPVAASARAVVAADTPASSASAAAPVTAGTLALDDRTTVSPRAAADAVIQGRCREAVALYRELHLRHPAVEAYREAARILQEQHVGCSEGK
jgi:hypothetical protein